MTARIFIGFDEAEEAAYHVLARSIQARASRPVLVAPVARHQLRGLFDRPRGAKEATAFSISRFMVPALCGFDGWAIFMDCDMLCRRDILELWDRRDARYAVQVVQHDHVPKGTTKFLGNEQTRYAKKNWSSLMLLNCVRCETLTPDYVNAATGLELHQFKWLENERLIGSLPRAWNHLVGYDPASDDAALVHYTEGGPYFNEYRGCEFSDDWFRERDEMLRIQQRT